MSLAAGHQSPALLDDVALEHPGPKYVAAASATSNVTASTPEHHVVRPDSPLGLHFGELSVSGPRPGNAGWHQTDGTRLTGKSARSRS